MRFMTYSHDSCGLGHLRRTFVVSQHLAAHVPDAMVLSLIGSDMAQIYFEPEASNHDYIKLPGVRKTGAEQYQPRHLPISLRDVIDLRRGLLKQAIADFQPDAIVVDKSPEGLEGELVPALENLRYAQRRAKIVLGLRDILDDPQVTRSHWSDPERTDWIDQIYDEIWIWGEPKVYNAVEEYGFPRAIREKALFMGYLPPLVSRNDVSGLREKAGIRGPGERMLLMTAGGGGDALPVFMKALEGLRQAACSHVRTLLVTGPLMKEEHFREIRHVARLMGESVRIARFLSHFEDWMRAADAIICMGGYNTLSEVAALGKPTLVIPRMWPRMEQSIRAEQFAQHGWCRIVEPGQSEVQAVAGYCRRLDNDTLEGSVSTLACRGLAALEARVESWRSELEDAHAGSPSVCEGGCA